MHNRSRRCIRVQDLDLSCMRLCELHGAQHVHHLLALLGQLVLAGNDLHGVGVPVALVLYQGHRAVRAHLACDMKLPIFKLQAEHELSASIESGRVIATLHALGIMAARDKPFSMECIRRI